MPEHPFEPLYGPQSRILILGSFPSVRSREEGYYYGHPGNRFWPMMARLLGARPPQSLKEKERLLLNNGFALWDVAKRCSVRGSSDSSISDVLPNPVADLVRRIPIQAVLLNGKTAARLYRAVLRPLPDCPYRILPSTSAANARWSLDRLVRAWGEALEGLGQGSNLR